MGYNVHSLELYHIVARVVYVVRFYQIHRFCGRESFPFFLLVKQALHVCIMYIYIYMCVCVYVCVCVCVCACVCVYIYMYIYAYLFGCMFGCVYVYIMNVWVCICRIVAME